VESIRVNQKLIRRALKYLEREQLLMSEHRRETRRGQKKDVVKAVLNANAEAEKASEDEDIIEPLARPHTISYYAVDFPRLFDVVQLRLHNMKKALKVPSVNQGAPTFYEHQSLFSCSKTSSFVTLSTRKSCPPLFHALNHHIISSGRT